MTQGQCLFEVGQDVGWDQRRFAVPAHHDFSTFPDGGLALEASLSHPTVKKAMTLAMTAHTNSGNGLALSSTRYCGRPLRS